MLNNQFINDLKKFGIFFIVYTVVFIIFFGTISYTFPFLIAFLIAFLIQPITKFLKDKLKLKKNIPSLLASLFVYIVFFVLVTLIFYKIILEVGHLVKYIQTLDANVIISPLEPVIEQIGQYFKSIDQAFIEENRKEITDIVSNSMNIIKVSLTTFLSLAISIPIWIAIVFVVILSTYFFSRDMSAIKEKSMTIFSEQGKQKFINIWVHGLKMFAKYIKAYSIVYSLTFIQTLIGFSILGIKYAFVLSVVSAVADVLPVLGIGLIYLPLVVIYLISGNYFAAIGLIILYVLITVIRQIVEPKVVSTSLGIHPVLVLAIIFIGFKAYGFIGMIYLITMVILYKILKASEVF